MLHCCCCLLLHAMTRAATASSHLALGEGCSDLRLHSSQLQLQQADQACANNASSSKRCPSAAPCVPEESPTSMELAGLNKEDLRARVQSCHVALLLLPFVPWEDARCESLIREDLLREDLLREGFLRQDPLMPGCTFLVPKQVLFVCVCALLILHSKISLCFKSSGCQNQINRRLGV